MDRKDTLIVMCSPNLRLMSAKRAIGSLKATDMSRAELILIDNCYDKGFSHPVVLNKMLKIAARRNKNMILLDDDIEVYDYHWIQRMYDVSERLNAAVVGCVNIFEDGTINNAGHFVDSDGFYESMSDFMHDSNEIIDNAAYVPTVCSATMLIRDCESFYFDTKYIKETHDLDLCIQAWYTGKRVACALDLKVIHHHGYIARNNPDYNTVYYHDCAHFSRKWSDFMPYLTDVPQLRQYKKHGEKNTWTDYYFRATRMKLIDKQRAIEMFKRIATDCYNERTRANACFHLYQIEEDQSLLQQCLQANPCHRSAAQQWSRLTGVDYRPLSSCRYNVFNCKRCYLRAP
ncbi:MAG: hypothetical protein HQL02_14490 [Nitrospirae bacterium]|nr:hypothetical protein [Nitrospirota bacterium]